VIVVSLKGGLGNQMFQYALGYKLARERGVPLKLDVRYLRDRTPRANFVYRDYDLDVFGIRPDEPSNGELWRFGLGMSNLALRLGIVEAAKRLRISRRIYAERTFAFDREVLGVGQSAYLSGYWQTEKYFADVADEVRKMFTVTTPATVEIEDMLASISGQKSVCLNVRRADFVTNPIYQSIDSDYFSRAVELLRGRIGDGFHLFIFSDDIDWCKSNLDFPSGQTIVEHRLAGQKFSQYLRLMAACKHFIIPNSTFAWWGAWLAQNPGKVVVAPQRWLATDAHDTSDILPVSWIKN
jgi:hypothetical protein